MCMISPEPESHNFLFLRAGAAHESMLLAIPLPPRWFRDCMPPHIEYHGLGATDRCCSIWTTFCSSHHHRSISSRVAPQQAIIVFDWNGERRKKKRTKEEVSQHCACATCGWSRWIILASVQSRKRRPTQNTSSHFITLTSSRFPCCASLNTLTTWTTKLLLETDYDSSRDTEAYLETTKPEWRFIGS